MNPNVDPRSKAYAISKIFNYAGGTLIFFGMTYLLFHHVFLLATASRILVTLGIALWSIAIAISLSRQDRSEAASALFYLIGGFLLPVGLGVFFHALNVNIPFDVNNVFISGICFALFALLQYVYPREILLLFCLFFGSSFFIACTKLLNGYHLWLNDHTLFNYQLLILGMFYLAIGYMTALQKNRLSGLLYFCGDLMFLIATFQLGGVLYDNNSILFFEVLAPIAVLISFALSIPLRSNALLYLAGLFLVIYIVNLTRQFASLFGSIGWPVLLIGAGMGLMLIGYLVMSIQKKMPK